MFRFLDAGRRDNTFALCRHVLARCGRGAVRAQCGRGRGARVAARTVDSVEDGLEVVALARVFRIEKVE